MDENKELMNENNNGLPIEDEKEYQWIKENVKWGHKVFLVLCLSVAAIIWVIGLIFGKVVEATLFQEVAKWFVGGIGVGLIVCVIFYGPIELIKLARIDYYPKYGKKWFWKAFRENVLGKKNK